MGLIDALTMVAVAIVACLHLAFFVLEAFFWTKPLGRRIFGLSAELANGSASLALNQGLYNAFIAAGLFWSLFPIGCAFAIRVFFLVCVVIAGIVGGLTAKRSILLIQALPGVIALLLAVLGHH